MTRKFVQYHYLIRYQKLLYLKGTLNCPIECINLIGEIYSYEIIIAVYIVKSHLPKMNYLLITFIQKVEGGKKHGRILLLRAKFAIA